MIKFFTDNDLLCLFSTVSIPIERLTGSTRRILLKVAKWKKYKVRSTGLSSMYYRFIINTYPEYGFSDDLISILKTRKITIGTNTGIQNIIKNFDFCRIPEPSSKT